MNNYQYFILCIQSRQSDIPLTLLQEGIHQAILNSFTQGKNLHYLLSSSKLVLCFRLSMLLQIFCVNCANHISSSFAKDLTATLFLKHSSVNLLNKVAKQYTTFKLLTLATLQECSPTFTKFLQLHTAVSVPRFLQSIFFSG